MVLQQAGGPLKLPGSVSDLSIIGADMYATLYAATTESEHGEFAIKHTLSRKVCDFIEAGMKPKDTCEDALLMVLRNLQFLQWTEREISEAQP